MFKLDLNEFFSTVSLTTSALGDVYLIVGVACGMFAALTIIDVLVDLLKPRDHNGSDDIE